MSNDASSVLAKARGEIGYCRWDDPKAGTKYGRWYATDHGSYYGVNGVPFCAMFVSWVFAQAGARCAGLPEAYCPYILSDARASGALLSDKTRAQPGDVVLFDWDGGVVDHVGIVESNHGSYVQTIEGNTTINGRSGSVGRRTRAWSTVEAVVRPSWGGGGSQASGGKIAVDGLWGPKTTLLAQQVTGAPYKDGVVSRQNPQHKGRMPGCTGGWEWTGSEGRGSQLIKILQRKWGATPDGVMGPDTINAMIRYYMARGSGATVCDGKLDRNSKTIAQFQRELNAGRI